MGKNIKTILLFVLVFGLSYSILKADFLTKDFFETTINWTSMTVSLPVKESLPRVVIDVNDPEYGAEHTAYNISESRTKALLKAKERISLHIAGKLEQIRLNNDYTIIEKINLDRNFNERFNKFIQLEQSELRVRFHQDKVFVESIIPFLGKMGLMNYLITEYDTEKFPEFSDLPVISNYTGLILDARHLKAFPGLFPRILTDKGLEIYSNHLVSKNFAIDRGLASYHSDPESAMKDPRVGKKPFYIVALTSLGKNKSDFSISTGDAKNLLANNETKIALKKCSVIILLSPE